MGKPEEIASAVAELEQATAPAAEKDEAQEIVKSLTNVIDRLTKAGLGSWEAAHNGNPLDKSAPMGDGAPSGGYNSTEEQENPDNSAARISASSKKGKASTPPTPTTLEKGKEDEEEVVINVNQDEDKKDDDDKDKDDDDDKKDAPPFTKKSQESVTEEKMFEALANNEDFVAVADASDAIQFLTETMAKAIAHISAQTASLSEEVHAELTEIRKSYAGQQEASLALLKAAKQILEEGKMNKSFGGSSTKTPAPVPASGQVLVIKDSDGKEPTAAQPKSVLVKSIVAAMSEEKLDKNVGTNLLLRLDSQNPGKVWETTPEDVRKVILDAGKTEPKK